MDLIKQQQELMAILVASENPEVQLALLRTGGTVSWICIPHAHLCLRDHNSEMQLVAAPHINCWKLDAGDRIRKCKWFSVGTNPSNPCNDPESWQSMIKTTETIAANGVIYLQPSFGSI